MTALAEPLADVRLRRQTDFADSPLSKALKQPLLLGLFLNLQAIRFSDLPTSSTWTFDYNAEVVKRADELGFEIAFSRTQWLPKGGYDGEASLDAFVALGAMAAITRNILLISTIHVLYGPWHPLHLAKIGATLDHVSKGRWGINIVTGHRAVEHEMFGWQRIEHDKRYDMADELFDVLHRLWSDDENYSHEGRLNPWRLQNGYITPKPLYGRPILVNATGSPAGIDFAAKHSDLIFITSPGGSHIESALETLPPHIARIKARARSFGHEVRTLINPIIVSRDTDAEAQAYAEAIHRNKPALAGPAFAAHGKGSNQGYDSDAHAWRGRADSSHKQGLGLGGNIEIVGSPEYVVEKIAALHAIGIDGLQINFYDFRADFDQFEEKILPLLKERGLRV